MFSQAAVSPVASSADAGYGGGHVEDNDDDDEDVSLLICSSTILTEIHFKSSWEKVVTLEAYTWQSRGPSTFLD